MNGRSALRKNVIIAAIAVLVLLLAVAGGTYAWFTFTTYTNVEPMRGSVSGGGVNLLIANDENGPFDFSCELVLSSRTDVIEPVTTSDLSRFFIPVRQNAAGIPASYSDITANAGNYLLSGTVWIKAEDAAASVYLHKDRLSFGDDPQALAAMRLGLRITTVEGTFVEIFRLDDMGNTEGASATWTIPRENTVYGGAYVADPALDIYAYAAVGTGTLTPAPNVLFTLRADETGRVDYWLYLEGCDPNCINSVKSRDIALQLGFAGLERAE